jgi:hypothetical protein
MLSDVRAIVWEVSRWTGIAPRIILGGHDRRRRVAFARRHVVWRLHLTGRSKSQVARLVHIDHTSVWHLLKKGEPPMLFPWRRPHVIVIRGKLAQHWNDSPVPDLSHLLHGPRRQPMWTSRRHPPAYASVYTAHLAGYAP